MADIIVVACGSGTGAAATVRSSKTKSTTRMEAGKTRGYSVPNGEHLLIEAVGSVSVTIRNDSTRPASVHQTKPEELKKILREGKLYQIPHHGRLTVSL